MVRRCFGFSQQDSQNITRQNVISSVVEESPVRDDKLINILCMNRLENILIIDYSSKNLSSKFTK